MNVHIYTLEPNYKSTKGQSYKCLHQQIPISILLIREILFFSDDDTNTSIISWIASIPILLSDFEIHWYQNFFQSLIFIDTGTNTDTWYWRPKYQLMIRIPIVLPIPGQQILIPIRIPGIRG